MKLGDHVIRMGSKISTGVIIKDLGMMSPGKEWPLEQAWLIRVDLGGGVIDEQGAFESQLVYGDSE